MNLKEFVSTLQYHDALNPKLWDGDKLKPIVRSHLLTIADKFKEYANIPDKAIVQIVMTGGNCNFNYAATSDIDVHLLIDLKKMVIQDPEIVRDLMLSKKDLWAKKHSKIKIYGYPVELYGQPVDEETPVQQGVYSLTNDMWVVQPNHLALDFNNDFAMAAKLRSWQHQINKALKSGDQDHLDRIKNKLWTMRGASLKADGEFAQDNLIFKELRNRGYLKRLVNATGRHTDQLLSLENISDESKM